MLLTNLPWSKVHNITALQEEVQSQLDLLDAMQSAARSLQAGSSQAGRPSTAATAAAIEREDLERTGSDEE